MFIAGEYGKCSSEVQMRDTENFSQTIHYVQFANPISSVNRTPVFSDMKKHEIHIKEIAECFEFLRSFAKQSILNSYANSPGFDSSIEISYIPVALSGFLDLLTGGGSVQITGKNGREYGVVLSSSEARAYLAQRKRLLDRWVDEKLEASQNTMSREVISGQNENTCYENFFELMVGKNRQHDEDSSDENQDMCDAMLVPFFIDECGNSYLVKHDYPDSSYILVCELGEPRDFSQERPRYGVIDSSISGFFAALANHSTVPFPHRIGELPPYSLIKWIAPEYEGNPPSQNQ